MIVANIKNLLEAACIETILRNEFASGGVGELSAFDAWPEVWLIHKKDEQRAKRIINASQHNAKLPDWFCSYCKEPNDASFEICWNCYKSC